MLTFSALGCASIASEEIISFKIETLPSPFKSSGDEFTGYLVKNTQFGEYGHQKSSLFSISDLTTLICLRHSKKDNFIISGFKDFTDKLKSYKPTVDGKAILDSKKAFQYQLPDWYVRTYVNLFQDQTCINELCFVDTRLLSKTNYSKYDGVLGLSRAQTTFPNRMKESLLGNRVFTISVDP